MLKNNKGSFTIEASIILPIIILSLVIFYRSIISQYIVYYGRGLLQLSNNEAVILQEGLYFNTSIKEGEIKTLNSKRVKLKCHSKSLNYLTWSHHYLMAEEIIGVFNEEVSTIQQ